MAISGKDFTGMYNIFTIISSYTESHFAFYGDAGCFPLLWFSDKVLIFSKNFLFHVTV